MKVNINTCTFLLMKGAFCDLIWSDPDDDIEGWRPSPRGAGWLFGSKGTIYKLYVLIIISQQGMEQKK